jgi:hypothetical protein
MEKQKVNLARVFSAAVHQPRCSDTIKGDDTHNRGLAADNAAPLYPHCTNSKVAAKHSPTWRDKSTSVFNSPSNVRIVYIGISGTYTGMWSQSSIGKALFQPFFIDGHRIPRLDWSKHSSTNLGLSCLVDPVLSNLEELWINAEILNCPANHQARALYQRYWRVGPGQAFQDEGIKQVLEAEISTPSKPRRVEDTFPLLRSIVVVGHIDYPDESTEMSDALTKLLSRNSKDLPLDPELNILFPGKRVSVGESLAILVKKHPELGVHGYTVCPVLSGDIRKFSVGDYKYDDLYLKRYREKILNSYSGDIFAEAKERTAIRRAAEIAALIIEGLRNEGISALRIDDGGYSAVIDLNHGETLCPTTARATVDYDCESDKYTLSVSAFGAPCDPGVKRDGFKIAAVTHAFLSGAKIDRLQLSDKSELVKRIVAAFTEVKNATSFSRYDMESLLDAIQSMEAQGLSERAITRALRQHKRGNSAYYADQIPKLPDSVRDKYAKALR